VNPQRPVSHLGYAVTDIEEAVHHWSSTLGAGPFFLVPDIEFDEVIHRGEPAVFAHSAAFGQWGSIAIELMQVKTTSPPELTRMLVPGSLPAINHVAYISDTAEQDSADLAAAGFELLMYAKGGEMEIRWHDTRAALGHTIEIHRDCNFINAAFRRIADGARNWDGRDPLRPMVFPD